MKKDNQLTVFFVLVFVLFYIASRLVDMWQLYGPSWNHNLIIIIVGIIYSLCIVGLYFLSGLHGSKEDFWDVSLPAKCKGGPYHWQGNSQLAKECRELASSKGGRCKIASYNCPTGYSGAPRLNFQYTPLSNDKWENERCDKNEKLPCHDGMCSMEKEISYPKYK